jgi:hypothetical protein
MENPFQFGRELGIQELVDRQEEVAEVQRTIRQGGKLFLIGPRRYGKTSILKAAEDDLLEQGAVILRYNAESYPTLDLLVAALVADAAKQLKGGVERAGEQIKKFFARLRPEVSFSVTDLAWTAKLGAAAAETENAQVKLLVDALEGLEKLAQAQAATRSVGLVIDEFQKIVETGGTAAEAQIRAAVQRHRRTGYVFAGSKTRLLTAMTMDAARPFYRLGSLRFVGPIPRAEFRAFLEAGFVEGQCVIAPATQTEGDALEFLLDLAEEVPYNVQLLAHTCWEQLRSVARASERRLTVASVKQALERIVRQYDPFYTQLWNSLTTIQQKTLLVVIAEKGQNLQSLKVLKVLGKGHSTVKRALEALTDKDILRAEESRGQVQQRFEDPFFAHWIKLFTPPA